MLSGALPASTLLLACQMQGADYPGPVTITMRGVEVQIDGMDDMAVAHGGYVDRLRGGGWRIEASQVHAEEQDIWAMVVPVRAGRYAITWYAADVDRHDRHRQVWARGTCRATGNGEGTHR